MTDLNEEDRELVRLIDEHWTPEPLTESARARLLRRLHERAEPRVRLLGVPAVAAATVALVGAAILVFGPGRMDSPPSEERAEVAAAWVSELVDPAEVLDPDPDAAGAGELLPDDYLAIETLLAEG